MESPDQQQIVLYWNLGSAPDRAIRSLLLLVDVDYQVQHLDLFKNEHRTPEMLKLNPSGKMPFLIVDEILLSENTEILKFLARNFPSLQKFYPIDFDICKKIDEALVFN